MSGGLPGRGGRGGRGERGGTRPSAVCRELLAALEASEGRRQRRKRDTTPDAIGLGIKRDLLERAVAADPEPGAFEAWLLDQCRGAGGAEGGVRAMALSIFEEWRLAQEAEPFREWLARGAPSDDAPSGKSPSKQMHSPSLPTRVSTTGGNASPGVKNSRSRSHRCSLRYSACASPSFGAIARKPCHSVTSTVSGST